MGNVAIAVVWSSIWLSHVRLGRNKTELFDFGRPWSIGQNSLVNPLARSKQENHQSMIDQKRNQSHPSWGSQGVVRICMVVSRQRKIIDSQRVSSRWFIVSTHSCIELCRSSSSSVWVPVAKHDNVVHDARFDPSRLELTHCDALLSGTLLPRFPTLPATVTPDTYPERGDFSSDDPTLCLLRRMSLSLNHSRKEDSSDDIMRGASLRKTFRGSLGCLSIFVRISWHVHEMQWQMFYAYIDHKLSTQEQGSEYISHVPIHLRLRW